MQDKIICGLMHMVGFSGESLMQSYASGWFCSRKPYSISCVFCVVIVCCSIAFFRYNVGHTYNMLHSENQSHRFGLMQRGLMLGLMQSLMRGLMRLKLVQAHVAVLFAIVIASLGSICGAYDSLWV